MRSTPLWWRLLDECRWVVVVVTGVICWSLCSSGCGCLCSATVAVVVASTLSYVSRQGDKEPATENSVVFITGCDTGLGFSLAVHAHQLGLTVIAGCLEELGAGAKQLREICGEARMHVVALDVTDEELVQKAVERVRALLLDHSLELKAVVNNAAVMVFGEFEWQTERQIRQQVEVNILGTMRVSKAFCSLLRKSKGRIIVVSSHCATAALPGLATYAATKGALRNWTDSMRVEQAKYGVHVISFVPGSFIDKSNIMARHADNAKEMEGSMSAADKNHFGQYFHRFHSYLTALSVPDRLPSKMEDAELYDKFEKALLSRNPRPYYVHEPTRYAIYHQLFKMTPICVRDRLVLRFIQMPSWSEPE